MNNLNKDFNDFFKKNKLTLSLIESITGGMFSSSVTDIKGASSFFKGGLVSYSNDVKTGVLGVSGEILNNYGAVSSECAKEMAVKGQQLFKSDVVISITGNAGPKPMENKPVGLIYIGIMYNDKYKGFSIFLEGTRKTIRKESINHIKYLFLNYANEFCSKLK